MVNSKTITAYKGLCGHCRGPFWSDEDEYCRYCGTKRGEGEFLPFSPEDNHCGSVYGPPLEYESRCISCGYSWSGHGVGGDPSQYCPKCGEKTLEIKEEQVDFDKVFKEIFETTP